MIKLFGSLPFALYLCMWTGENTINYRFWALVFQKVNSVNLESFGAGILSWLDASRKRSFCRLLEILAHL